MEGEHPRDDDDDSPRDGNCPWDGYPPWDGDCPRHFDHHRIQANWNRQADKPRYWEACIFSEGKNCT